MSNINISDQKHSGTSLFNDARSYLTELDDSVLTEVNGGFRFPGGEVPPIPKHDSGYGLPPRFPSPNSKSLLDWLRQHHKQ
jgi:hypothetical protein